MRTVYPVSTTLYKPDKCCSGYTLVFAKANGNTLICESVTKRVFEVTTGGETVWDYVVPAGSPRSYRYAYNHCPQAAALGIPSQIAVTPPSEFSIPPDEPPQKKG